MDRIGEVGDSAGEEQAAGMYGADLTAKSLARLGARDGMRGTGIKVRSDKELTEIGVITEGDWGGTRE